MKTTVDIPDKVMREAMAYSRSATKRDAVVVALEDFNRRARLRILAEQFGKSETFMTLDELFAMRSAETSELEDR